MLKVLTSLLKSMPNRIIHLFIGIIVLIGLSYFIYNYLVPIIIPEELPNPATVYCEENGGEYIY
jgi:hypothetical protein